MTNYEKWKAEYGYREPSKMSIICMNSHCCEECPIFKKFHICESDNETREKEIEKWLNSEVEENV